MVTVKLICADGTEHTVAVQRVPVAGDHIQHHEGTCLVKYVVLVHEGTAECHCLT